VGEGGNYGEEVTLPQPVESSLEAEGVFPGPYPGSELETRLLPDLPPRGFLVRLCILEPSPRRGPPRPPAVLEPNEQNPAGLVEQDDAGGVANGRNLPCRGRREGIGHEGTSLADDVQGGGLDAEGHGQSAPELAVELYGYLCARGHGVDLR
jgi:hypothetical protein